MREFKGRAVIPGTCKGEALVTKTGLNVLATYVKSLMDADGSCICNDINNKDLYGKAIGGGILCIPQTIGSTSAGFMLQAVAAAGLQPKALLYARPAEPLVLAGILVADIWEDTRIITIDDLGQDFLDSVRDGDEIEIQLDGTVRVYSPPSA
ncbi:MAG: DUF126 domain-containing protein [Oscillospiraceae bacterium]|nr:DUF126 domain-containing protein [Oscillospiraceae bacterium]